MAAASFASRPLVQGRAAAVSRLPLALPIGKLATSAHRRQASGQHAKYSLDFGGEKFERQRETQSLAQVDMASGVLVVVCYKTASLVVGQLDGRADEMRDYMQRACGQQQQQQQLPPPLLDWPTGQLATCNDGLCPRGEVGDKLGGGGDDAKWSLRCVELGGTRTTTTTVTTTMKV